MVGLPENADKIFLNEHLTPFNAKLAFYSRRLKKNGHIANFSTKKGVIRILTLTDDSPKWITVGHHKDLIRLFPDLENIIKIDD